MKHLSLPHKELLNLGEHLSLPQKELLNLSEHLSLPHKELLNLVGHLSLSHKELLNLGDHLSLPHKELLNLGEHLSLSHKELLKWGAHLSPWFLGGKSEYILKFPPHTQFSHFALIDYTRAMTPIRARPYGDFCRAFDAEEGRSPLFFSICNTFWNISQWLQFDPYVLFLSHGGHVFSSTDI